MILFILKTNVVNPKLKISPAKAVLKVPMDVTLDDVRKLVELSKYIIQNLPAIQTTLIGRFRYLYDKWYIQLSNDSRTYCTQKFREIL
jgi:hypothetical protein